jgi:hypothetical protein
MSYQKKDSVASRVKRRCRNKHKRKRTSSDYQERGNADPDYTPAAQGSYGESGNESTTASESDCPPDSGSESDSEPLSKKVLLTEGVQKKSSEGSTGYALLYAFIMKKLNKSYTKTEHLFAKLLARPNTGEPWRLRIQRGTVPMFTHRDCTAVVAQLKELLLSTGESENEEPVLSPELRQLETSRQLKLHSLDVAVAQSRVKRNQEEKKAVVSELELSKEERALNEEKKKAVVSERDLNKGELELSEEKKKKSKAVEEEIQQFLDTMVKLSQYEGKVSEYDLELARGRARQASNYRRSFPPPTTPPAPHSSRDDSKITDSVRPRGSATTNTSCSTSTTTLSTTTVSPCTSTSTTTTSLNSYDSSVLPCPSKKLSGSPLTNPHLSHRQRSNDRQVMVSNTIWRLYPHLRLDGADKFALYKEVGRVMIQRYRLKHNTSPPLHSKGPGGPKAYTYYDTDEDMLVQCIHQVVKRRRLSN